MVSKLDFVVVVGSVLGVTLWIEHGHRTYIGSPTDVEIATSRARAAACSDTDAVPYNPHCLVFLKVDIAAASPRRATAAERALVAPPDVPN